MKLHPFKATHPAAGYFESVASPPYDVINTAEARAIAEGNAHSFLHVTRPEIDMDESVDIHDQEVYAQGAKALSEFIQTGILVTDSTPSLWVYRLDMGSMSQVGIVGCADVADYVSDRIKKHEFTRPDKEDDRTTHVNTLGAHTGPVFLTCRDDGKLTALAAAMSGGTPDADFIGYGDVRHRVWCVSEPQVLAQFETVFEPMDAFYIADGHHRAASAARVSALRDSACGGDPPTAPWRRFLTVVFPDNQVEILAYNRVVHDLNGLSDEAFLARLNQAFEVSGPDATPVPRDRHTFGMFLAGTWRQLSLRDGVGEEGDPIKRLDVAVLQDLVLAPILGVHDPRTDKRITFVGGIRGTTELEHRVIANGGGVAFSMFPTSVNELLAVADAGDVMPPKSTWFEPKLASGLFVNLIGPAD